MGQRLKVRGRLRRDSTGPMPSSALSTLLRSTDLRCPKGWRTKLANAWTRRLRTRGSSYLETVRAGVDIVDRFAQLVAQREPFYGDFRWTGFPCDSQKAQLGQKSSVARLLDSESRRARAANSGQCTRATPRHADRTAH